MQEQITEHDGTTWPNQNKEASFEMYMKGAHQGYVMTRPTDAEHDYDEPYFEPASQFDTLLEQLKELAVTNVQESSLRSVETLACTYSGGGGGGGGGGGAYSL